VLVHRSDILEMATRCPAIMTFTESKGMKEGTKREEQST